MLAGGISHEREVSLRSGSRLAAALRGVGLDVREWDVDGALVDQLRADPPDAVVDRAARGRGRERLRAGGAGAAGGAVRRDPVARVPAGVGQAHREGRAGPRRPRPPRTGSRCRTARSGTLGAQAVLDAMVDQLGLPLMLKPDQGGSALGAQVVSDRAELPAAMVELPRLRRHRAGRAVRRRRGGGGHGGRGRKVPRARCPPSRWCPKSGVYDYTPATPPALRTSTARPGSTPRRPPRWRTLAVGAHRAPRPARRLPHRRDRRRRRRRALPGGQRLARA